MIICDVCIYNGEIEDVCEKCNRNRKRSTEARMKSKDYFIFNENKIDEFVKYIFDKEGK